MAADDPLPDDLLIDAAAEVRVRQDLVLTALGKQPELGRRPGDRRQRPAHRLGGACERLRERVADDVPEALKVGIQARVAR